LPLGAVRPAVAHLRLAQRTRHEVLARGALRTEPATRYRTVVVTLDLDDLLVLDVDLLAAADRAVGTDAAGDAVRRGDAWRDRVGPGRPDGGTAAERGGTGELAQHRPAQERPLSHRVSSSHASSDPHGGSVVGDELPDHG